ncbi:hypothetical protein LSH36_158g00001 [Paralvinella palmiformis]|uniref:G-protein coupled receptors family 1 profile domain-containing protein n=1 Tax=Paralvinella palmiformis TaxID=53620 RepID=A0AAD9JUF2_9ANNE|nr:hypothetical protein LSH36_158g00001 [Paralvinella palmiformis]
MAFELHRPVTTSDLLDSRVELNFSNSLFRDDDDSGHLATNGVVPLNASRADQSAQQQMMSIESVVILIVIYTLTTLLALSGNAVVIVVFTVGKRSRGDLRGFLINLACADLIMSIFCMPFTFTMTMLNNWVFSRPMCPIVLYLQTVSVTASVCTNMAIGIDRFWVVMFPLKSRITKSRSKWVILSIWMISMSISAVQLAVGRSNPTEVAPGQVVWDCNEVWPEPKDIWRRSYTFFILSTTYLIPLFILAVTYGFVAWKLWQRTTPGNADEARDMQQLRSKRKNTFFVWRQLLIWMHHVIPEPAERLAY